MRLVLILIVLCFSQSAKTQAVFQKLVDMERFFSKNLQYPQEAIDNGISGYVLIKFDVAVTGTLDKKAIVFAESSSLGNEVMRVLEKSDGKWTGLLTDSQPTTFFMQIVFESPDFGFFSADSLAYKAIERRVIERQQRKEERFEKGVLLSPLVVIGYATQRKRI